MSVYLGMAASGIALSAMDMAKWDAALYTDKILKRIDGDAGVSNVIHIARIGLRRKSYDKPCRPVKLQTKASCLRYIACNLQFIADYVAPRRRSSIMSVHATMFAFILRGNADAKNKLENDRWSHASCVT